MYGSIHQVQKQKIKIILKFNLKTQIKNKKKFQKINHFKFNH